MFRLFHPVLSILFRNDPAENILASTLKHSSQKRYIKPGSLNHLFSHPKSGTEDLIFSKSLHLRDRLHKSMNCIFFPALDLCKFHWLFIDLIVSWIVFQQIQYCMYANFRKRQRSLLSDSSCFFLFYIIHDCISIINHIRTYILFYFHLFEILYFFNKFYKKYCIFG